MALPRSLQQGLLPTEVEYIASNAQEVDIVPQLSIDRVRLLGGIYGPFRPPAKARVPLWLAANLKSKKKCVIVPPDWLAVEPLTELLKEETANARFADVPLHYVAVAKVILDVAADDVPSSDRVRTLLKDLREARQSKVLAGLEMLNPLHLEMTNISSLEIAELRPFFSTAFKHLRALQPASTEETAAADANADTIIAYPRATGGTGHDSTFDVSRSYSAGVGYDESDELSLGQWATGAKRGSSAVGDYSRDDSGYGRSISGRPSVGSVAGEGQGVARPSLGAQVRTGWSAESNSMDMF